MNIETKRHSLAHIASYAIEQLFGKTYFGTGPSLENGWFHDYEIVDHKLSVEDFPKIDAKMREIIESELEFTHQIVDYDTAKKIAADDKFKLELIEDFKNRGETEFSFYTVGTFVNLCAGPHIENTRTLKKTGWKLDKLAGAYWKADENNPQMTRIYGIAFENTKELREYGRMMEEAARRDHRKLGKELGLFTFSDLVGSGLPLFTPKGTAMREAINDAIWKIQKKYGFERVSIPHIAKSELYKVSGHWEKYKDDLFRVRGKGDTEFVMKPMNCPHHSQIYASQSYSYRDLPIRFAETTACYRDEQQGELLGLSRVRGFSQDDGHTFCRLDQLKVECKNLVAVIREFYTKLGMFEKGKFRVSLSVRDPAKPEKYLGNDKNWDAAEKYLTEIADEENLPCEREEGEAAFYGPKLDFMFRDSIGREWQLATIQIDFVQPERFKLEYTNEHGEKETPVMIHRAIAGSLERFMSVIIEHFAGAFPFWLAPTQVAILPVNEVHEKYAASIADTLREHDIRITTIDPRDSLGKRIREAAKKKIPHTLIIGDAEAESDSVTVREFGGDGEQKTMKMSEYLEFCEELIK